DTLASTNKAGAWPKNARAAIVYVVDSKNGTIRRLSPSATGWVVTTIAGLAGVRGSADGTNSDIQFGFLSGVAVDSEGNLYVADYCTIRRLTEIGTNWVSSTIAGKAGHAGHVDGTNNDARFYEPAGIATDSVGNLFVAEQSNSTIRKLTRMGTDWVTTTIAGL